MQLPPAVQVYVEQQGWGRVNASQAVGGGCINDGRVLETTAGPRLFLKYNRSAPPAMFEREAEGLRALAEVPGAPRVPIPYLAGEEFLLLEYLAPDPPAPDYWPEFGRRLARLHAAVCPRFGWAHANYLGATPQPNDWHEDGHAFFVEQRLRYQGRLARVGGLLGHQALQQLESVARRLPELIPPQPASLIHGDLWSGNIIPGPGGHACLIDPAPHFGWAEADLAMMALFGRPPETFYAAYTAERPLEPGWRERLDLYNLYHLLNHLNLFGRGYLDSVETILSRYA